MRTIWRKLVPALITGLAACDQPPHAAVSAPVPSLAKGETQGGVLATVRAATAKYHRVEVANADGYVRFTPCIFDKVGSRGIHFPNFALVNDGGVLDPSQPEVLLYEMTKNGEYRLVGVEYLIPAVAWDASHTSPPMLGDQPFMDRRQPPFGADFPNYALFVWAWRHNPNGLHELSNPQASCEFADVSVMR